MICPRCSIGEIPDTGTQCTVCGFVPGTNVVLEAPPRDEVLEGVRKVLHGRFDIQALLRVGERSFVYLARELDPDRLVALKVIPVAGGVGRDLAQRFAQQADLARRVRDAHTVPLHDYGSSHSFVWYTMPHLQDATLAEWLRRSGPMDPEACAMLLQQVAAGLDHAHRQGIVHANLKPGNIFVSPEKWVRVSDFALLEPFRTAGGTAVMPARPEYMAPEQFHGRGVGPSVDQYALGVIAWECLTGVLPFVGDSFEEVARLHLSEPPPPITGHRRDVPVPMADAVRRALGKAPPARFPTILDFASALSQGATRRGSGPVRVSGPNRTTPMRLLLVDTPAPAPRRRAGLGIGIALASIAATGVLIWSLWGDLPWQRHPPAGPLVLSPGEFTVRTELPFEKPRSALPPAPAHPGPPVSAPRRANPALARPTPARARPTPARPPELGYGRLFVNATPWGELSIDGVLVGNTPKADLVLPAGTHVIRVARDGFVPFEQQVQVAAGQSVRLTDIVLAPRPQ